VREEVWLKLDELLMDFLGFEKRRVKANNFRVVSRCDNIVKIFI